MASDTIRGNGDSGMNRRDFLRTSSAFAATAPLVSADGSKLQRPNVILIISDQFRGDCLGANHRNPLNLTPNLDAMAREGTNFANSITNQPLCGPSRACIFSGQYPARSGIWKNDVPLTADKYTVAKAFRAAGYTANYIGKWHLAPTFGGEHASLGPVAPEYRGGFDDFWEGCNVMELTSHPYKGAMWDSAGREIPFDNEYRMDFVTDRAVRFLRQPTHEPFFLVISYLEPHFQNDCNCFVAPKGYAERYKNSYIPRDLKFFPGDWQEQLPEYYGCIARVDENVGRLRNELRILGLLDRTVTAFVSDHGCHFRTRNSEYKRSAHESSVHVPLVISGPRFAGGRTVRDLVNHIDLAPTLLAAAGIATPPSMQGRSVLPIVENGDSSGRNQDVFIQVSESMTGRALRTPQWTYVVVTPDGKSQESATRYVEYQLYDLYADPNQLVNLAGRVETRKISAELRERLRLRMLEAGDQAAAIDPAPLYP